MTARAVLVAFLTIGLALVPAPSSAIPVTPGSELILNWDLPSIAPPPPYLPLEITFKLDFPVAGVEQQFTIGLFDDLNGQGGLVLGAGPTTGTGPFSTTIVITADATCNCPLLTDGTFSLVLTALEPGLELVFATASGVNATGVPTGDISGTVATGVPEPSTLALVGLGLVALGLWRRRP